MRRGQETTARTGFRDGGWRPGAMPGGHPSLDPVERHEASFATSRDSPELRLMRAVLEDAVTRYRQRPIKTGKTSSLHWRITRDEAERWFASKDRVYLFSFERVCEQLGLEPDAIRRALARQDATRMAYRTGQRGGTGRMVGRVVG